MKYQEKTVKEACRQMIHVENKDIEGDLGIIGVDKDGNIALEFNSERMHRGWITGDKEPIVKIYRD
jgi:beta-aspartyl-peptidase (threonine type)